MTKFKVLLAGAALAVAVVPATASPAQACGGTQCILDCIYNFANGELVCKF